MPYGRPVSMRYMPSWRRWAASGADSDLNRSAVLVLISMGTGSSTSGNFRMLSIEPATRRASSVTLASFSTRSGSPSMSVMFSNQC